jgi:RNA polymerase sigma factor (sigma-70 family)
VEASALSAPAALTRESGTSPWLRLRSDEQLVGLFRTGSEDAFRIIHDRYRQRLFAYARQMLGGSDSDAEDVMQDVFLRAYRSLRVDARPVSLRAWLYRVAHNRCIDTLRRPVPPPSDIFEMSRTPAHDPSAEVERREDLQRLVADVRRLPEQQRSALLMREMDGMSYADLAVALETSVPAVKSLLVRARIGLVEAIEARDADCADIRHDLAASYDRGVRTTGRARRHLRECDGCTTYRAQLRTVRQGFAALSPGAAAPGLVAKLLGLSSATSGAGAAAGGAASGTSVAIGGGAAAAVSITKVAAVVCCAAAITGSAVEVQKMVAPSKPAKHSVQVAPIPAVAAPPAADALRSGAGASAPVASSHMVPTAAADDALHPSITMGELLAPPKDNGNGSGGHAAPEALSDSPIATPAPAAAPADEEGGALPITDGVLPLTGEDAEGPTGSGAEQSSETTSSTSGTHSSTSGSGTSGSSTSGSSTSGSSTSGEATASSTSGSSTSDPSVAGGSPAPGSAGRAS